MPGPRQNIGIVRLPDDACKPTPIAKHLAVGRNDDGYNTLMVTLFPDSAEYPDFEPFPRFTARLGHDGPIVPLAIAATLFGLCPVVLEEHGHPIHENHSPVSYRVPALAVSSMSTGSITATPSTGVLDLTGHAPTIVIAPSSTGSL